MSHVIGAAIEAVVAGACGVRPAAERAVVPHSTAREWVRRFGQRCAELAASFAAVAVELGGALPAAPAGRARQAIAAMKAAWHAAVGLPGWLAIGAWGFYSAVTGGSLIATNTSSPWLSVGKRRFMPPVP